MQKLAPTIRTRAATAPRFTDFALRARRRDPSRQNYRRTREREALRALEADTR